MAAAGFCPTSAALDAFNRPNGGVGAGWLGSTGTGFYRIVNNSVDVVNGGPIYWNASVPFGSNQDAFVTLTTVDPAGPQHGLLMKVQGATPSWQMGAIKVRYEPLAGGVRIETYRPGQPASTLYAVIPVTFVNGDQLGARINATGEIQIYKSCALVGATLLNAADQAFFNPLGGRTGIWFSGPSNAFLDDFGGGNFLP